MSDPMPQASLLRARPDHLVIVAGTGTEVGKTWVTAHLAALSGRRGVRVNARKPAQSFDPGDDDAERTDAHVLAAATGEAPSAVCRRNRWYPIAMAPPMAAEALDRPPLLLDDLLDDLSWSPAADLVLVETAGGVRSPMALDGDTVDLCHRLGPDQVVLVADAGLGTINSVLLSAAALAPWPVVVMLNRYDAGIDLHRRNRTWLVERQALHCVTDVEELHDALTR